jgi:hypothetical protein
MEMLPVICTSLLLSLPNHFSSTFCQTPQRLPRANSNKPSAGSPKYVQYFTAGDLEL